MKRILLKASIFGTTIAMTVAFAVSAATISTSTKTTKQPDGITKAQDKNLEIIDKRVEELNKLIIRTNETRNLTEVQKTTITSTVQSLIINLKSFKSKIENSTSSQALKADKEQLSKTYRVHALFMPQINIIASADRVITVLNMLLSIGPKLEARMNQFGTTTENVIAWTDYKAKMIEANSLAQTAVSQVVALFPDEGDKTKMAENLKILKDSRSKIQAAHKDLVAARKDLQSIINFLVKADKDLLKVPNPNATSTVSASSSSQ